MRLRLRVEDEAEVVRAKLGLPPLSPITNTLLPVSPKHGDYPKLLH